MKGLYKSCNISGWLSKKEAELLYNEAKKIDDGLIVEIGSWQGKSTFFLAKGSSAKNKIFAIDTFKGSTEHQKIMHKYGGSTKEIFINNMKKHNLLKDITIIENYSFNVVKQFEDESIDLLFIDGSHDYESLKKDFELYYPKVKMRGNILFHDSNHPPIKKFLSEIKNNVGDISKLDSIFCCKKIGKRNAPYYHPGKIIDFNIKLDEFARRINKGNFFSYLRYGDGEFKAMFGDKGENCDQHKYYPEMGRNLIEAIINLPFKEELFFGLHGRWDQDRIQKFIVDNGLKNTRHWIGNIIFENGLIDGTVNHFTEALIKYKKQIVVVGPKRINEVAKVFGGEHVVIPEINCYSMTKPIIETLKSFAIKGNTIFLFSASMASEHWINELYKVNKNNWYIDCGSFWDGICGKKVRGYQNNDKYVKIIENYKMRYGFK